jgi:hypothetical protein
MSVAPQDRASETVAGLMASAAIFVSFIGLAYKPVRLIPAALLVALVAAGIGGRHRRLAAGAVGVGVVCWVVGMTIAIATDRALY